MAKTGDSFKPGQEVPNSGIYDVIHDKHAQAHEVTCVYGEPFPPCKSCGHAARFVLVRAAQHIDRNKHFA